ncbi:AraC family transcriptional regulator ligand-binding domain-containing protein [Pseudoalteromonas espejiana]
MHTLSDYYFSSILDFLQSQGLNAQNVLSAISFNEYVDKNNLQLAPRISLQSYNALLSFASKALNNPLFGFELGKHIRTADYGVLGYLIESSSHLANAIESLLHYDSLVADIGKAHFEQHADTATVRWLPHALCNTQVIQRNMTAWVSVIRQLLNPQLSPTRVEFTQSFTLQQIKQLSTWFNCPVKGNAQYNQISFAKAFLALPFKTDNSAINSALKQVSQQQLSEFKSQQNLSEHITVLLMAKSDLQECTLIKTAAAVNLTPRTLQRRLKENQLTFAQLLENERKRRAEILINNTSLIELATLLGFKDQSSFNRAFYRWYGCSPRKYREKT